MPPDQSTLACRCVIAGGGPAGIMTGYLLARAGIDVIVLEKHADFFRDFRGDTIHPSTMDNIAELGLLDVFLAPTLQKVEHAEGEIGGQHIRMADFTRLPTRCRFIAFMPQWDFLNFLAEKAAKYPTFRLHLRAEVTGLVEEGGRRSVVREKAGLEIIDEGAPIDVFWMKLSRREGDPHQPLGRFDQGKIF